MKPSLIFILLLATLAVWVWLHGSVPKTNENPEMNPPSNFENYWVPKFVLGSVQPDQDKLIPKLGGLPWGFPASSWPICRSCGHTMSHMAQLPHVEEIFDLGKPGEYCICFTARSTAPARPGTTRPAPVSGRY